MDEHDWLAERFEENRPHLRTVAYRVLGSFSEADEAVRETWLRLSLSGAGEAANLGGWLTAIVARVSLNMLRSRTARREQPMHPPVIDQAEASSETDPGQEAVLADSVSLALLIVLDALTPAERLAFVLHDMFAMPFGEIAPIVERSPPPPGNWPAGPAAGSSSRTTTRSPAKSVPAGDSSKNSHWMLSGSRKVTMALLPARS